MFVQWRHVRDHDDFPVPHPQLDEKVSRRQKKYILDKSVANFKEVHTKLRLAVETTNGTLLVCTLLISLG